MKRERKDYSKLTFGLFIFFFRSYIFIIISKDINSSGVLYEVQEKIRVSKRSTFLYCFRWFFFHSRF